MSSIKGGIFSRPRGQTGGLVFGAARSRTGKVVTIREKVIPTNPRTAAQVTQRSKFSETLTVVRTWGATIYQSAWNRAIGQLAGFQSLMSVLLTQINATLDYLFTIPVNLGTLHNPLTMSLSSGGTGELAVTYSTESGINGSQTDQVFVIAVASSAANRALPNSIMFINSETRADGSTGISNLIVGANYEIYVYLIGNGTAAGLKSVAQPFSFTVL